MNNLLIVFFASVVVYTWSFDCLHQKSGGYFLSETVNKMIARNNRTNQRLFKYLEQLWYVLCIILKQEDEILSTKVPIMADQGDLYFN